MGRGDPEYLAQRPQLEEKYSRPMRHTMIAAKSLLLELYGVAQAEPDDSNRFEEMIDRAAVGETNSLEQFQFVPDYLEGLTGKSHDRLNPRQQLRIKETR